MDTLTEYLLEFGSMGMFAAFLVWQHLNMQKRFDSLIDRFQEQIEKLRSDQKSEIDDVRDRYDKVISTYNEERDQIRVDLVDQMRNVESKISCLSKELESLPFETVQIQIEGLSLNQRNAQIALDKIQDYLKKMEEEAKLKAMARKMADRDS